MGKKKYTVLVLSQQASKVKKFILSPLTLKVGAVGVAALLAVFGYLLYNYSTYQKKVADLKKLRAEMQSRQAEIESFAEKISLLEEQLSRLKSVEEQVKKDLREVQELRKERMARKTRLPHPPSKVKGDSQAVELKNKTVSREGDQVSLLEEEGPRLSGRMDLDLMELSREASAREKSLKVLQEFLLAQKSVLLSMPTIWPVLGRITSGFGAFRVSASSGGSRPHAGIDIGAPVGTPVIAPADGTVLSAGREGEYGRLICLDHGNGYTTAFGHLNEMQVKAGEKVRAGQILGTVGRSGITTGPHLHYEVRLNGKPVNPSFYLSRAS